MRTMNVRALAVLSCLIFGLPACSGDTDDAAPYGPNQIAKLLRDEMKAAKMDVRKLIRSAALSRMNASATRA